MARTTRDGRKRLWRRDRDDAPFELPTKRELSDIVGDHLIPEGQREATTTWQPSRRGFSPHHRG